MKPPRKMLEYLLECKRLHELGKISKAAEPARKAYALAEKHLPVGHPARQQAALALGRLLLLLNQHEAGQRLMRECGVMSADPEASLDIRERNNNLQLQLQSNPSTNLFQFSAETLAMARDKLTPDSDELAIALTNHGRVLEWGDNFAAAEPLYDEALRLLRGREVAPKLLSSALLDSARMDLRKNRYERAERLYREAADLQRNDNDPLGVAITLNQLGHVCAKTGRADEALGYLRESLKLRQEVLGADHPQVTLAMRGIAAIAMQAEAFDEAERLLTQGWRLLDRSLGARDQRTIEFLAEAGFACLAQHKYELAIQHLEKALELAAHLPYPFRQRILEPLAQARELQSSGA